VTSIPISIGSSSDPILQRVFRSYRDEEGAIQALESEKLDLLQHYDVPGMETAVAICFWGRSGSLLLASYLDGHDDIVILPMLTSESIYLCFHEYQFLSVWEKLLAYPEYSEFRKSSEGVFFKGDFAIAAADYYAAVHALFAVYGDRPAAWLDSRMRFFQLVHVAYAVATGRRSGSGRPLMIYAQHCTDDEVAARFVEDFPSARFIHTIRDPISSFDSWFDRVSELRTRGCRPSGLAPHYLSPGLDSVRDLLTWDRAHRGMEARTRAIRFEDLHLAPEATMRRLADWLGIPYLPCLVESTWNGTPWFVKVRGVVWCGSNPDNARRRSKNLHPADRLMIFALLRDNFIEWNYPSPTAIRRRGMCLCIIALLWIVPMKLELVTARWMVRLQVMPNLRRGRLGFACRAPFFLLKCRLQMMLLIAAQGRARLAGDRRLLKVL
jgi:Sulfotransferase family